MNKNKKRSIVIYPEWGFSSIRLLNEEGSVIWLDPIEEIPIKELQDQEFYNKVNRLDELYDKRFIPDNFEEYIKPTKEELDEMLSIVDWLYKFIKEKVGNKYNVKNWADKEYLE